jgi:hypothetical protein
MGLPDLSNLKSSHAFSYKPAASFTTRSDHSNKAVPCKLATMLNPVPEQNNSCRTALLPDTGIDGRNEHSAMLGLHPRRALGEHHDGQVSHCSELLQSRDDVLKHRQSSAEGKGDS